MGADNGGIGNVGASEEPTNPWDAAQAQYLAANAASLEAMSAMQTLLAQIIGRKGAHGEKISTDQAYQELVELSSDTTNVKGTEAGQQGSAQNLGAVGTQQIAQWKGDLSTLETYFTTHPETPGSAPIPLSGLPINIQNTLRQFSSLFSSLREIVNQQSSLAENDPARWLDTATCQNMTTQLNVVCSLIGEPSGSVDLNPGFVAMTINNAVNGSPSRAEGASNLQQLSGSINEIGGGFGAITSTQSGLLQNTMAMVTMMLNTMRGTITSINSAAMAMVRAQRAAG